MELRHLETLLAIAEEGSFTAAADALHTVQSNVSEQVRQLEAELGVPLLVRSRRGAEPTEFGAGGARARAPRPTRARGDARRPRRCCRGSRPGTRSLGVVGTASRWLVPALVADLRERAPGVRLRVNEGASERLFAEVLDGELAQAVVTEPVDDRRLVVEHLLEEALVGLVGARRRAAARAGAAARRSRSSRWCSRPIAQPAAHRGRRARPQTPGSRSTCRSRSRASGSSPTSSPPATTRRSCPETAVPPELANVRTVAIAGLPPRRLAMVDRARHAAVTRRSGRPRQRAQRSSPSTSRRGRAPQEAGTVADRSRSDRGRSMAAQPVHDDGRKVNVKLIVLGILAAVLVLFALLNTHEVGVDFVLNTWSASLILVIAISAAIGFALGLPYEGAPGRSSLERLTAVAGSVSVTGSIGGPRPARVKMRAAT